MHRIYDLYQRFFLSLCAVIIGESNNIVVYATSVLPLGEAEESRGDDSENEVRNEKCE